MSSSLRAVTWAYNGTLKPPPTWLLLGTKVEVMKSPTLCEKSEALRGGE
jgi:hypothetical protein